MASFVQTVFNDISLEKNPKLWMDATDSDKRNVDRLSLIAEFPDADFAAQLSASGASVRICSGKNGKLSSALLEKAKLAFAQDAVGEAVLVLLNQSLQFAPPTDADLAVQILGLRSALWAERRRWRLAVRDVDRALAVATAASLPPLERCKLLERKGNGLIAQGQTEAGAKTIQEAIDVLNTSGLKGAKLKSKTEQISKMQAAAEASAGIKRGQSPTRSVPVLQRPHPHFPNLSDCVSVRFSADSGRFCVASRDIDVGEVIAVDTPFAWMLDKEEVRRRCWQCCAALETPLACQHCSGVLYCGEDCQSEAASFHQYECGITDLLNQANIGAWTLAFRAVIRLPLDLCQSGKETAFGSHDARRGAENSPCGLAKASSEAASFFHLVTHSGAGGAKQAPELMMQALVAIFLLRCLQFKGYMPRGVESGKLDGHELAVAMLLHHFMRVAYFNTHEMAGAQDDGEGDLLQRMRRIGRATNPSLALFNHSCDPNYRRITVGKRTVGVTVRPVLKGEELTDTYCQPFAVCDRESRREALRKYDFVCACVACREEWPAIARMPSRLVGQAPDRYMVQGSACKEAVKRVTALQQKLVSLTAKGADSTALLEAHLELVRSLRALLKPPHQLLCVAENDLYRAMLKVYCAQK